MFYIQIRKLLWKLTVFTVAATHLRLYAGIELLEEERRSQRNLRRCVCGARWPRVCMATMLAIMNPHLVWKLVSPSSTVVYVMHTLQYSTALLLYMILKSDTWIMQYNIVL